MNKLVLFGAGKIGRSFIAQLFARSNYEVVFIDKDLEIVAALNARREYSVIIKDGSGDKAISVRNVRGVHASNENDISREIANADIMAISVGPKALPIIAPAIAKGILERQYEYPDYPLDIILAENLRNAAKIFGNELKHHLDKSIDISVYLGLIETSIGKMVPIMPKEVVEQDPLLVYAEPYNTLILDGKAFRNPIPKVAGLAPKENMPAWVDRKSFIHNLGHAAGAYYGFVHYPEMTYMFEIMAKKDVCDFAKSVMCQAADILMGQYPNEFTKNDLKEHIEDLILRFSSQALGDTVYRVGQDLYRKLGPEERVVGAIKMAIKHNMPYDKILKTLDYAFRFQARDEQGFVNPGDSNFMQDAHKGKSYILNKVCGLSKEQYPDIHKQLAK